MLVGHCLGVARFPTIIPRNHAPWFKTLEQAGYQKLQEIAKGGQGELHVIL